MKQKCQTTKNKESIKYQRICQELDKNLQKLKDIKSKTNSKSISNKQVHNLHETKGKTKGNLLSDNFLMSKIFSKKHNPSASISVKNK